MASFYADENFRYPVVEQLRRLGHDVLTSQEAGHAGQGIDDELVLNEAWAMLRILLTQNRVDFKKLHRKGLDHRGIVVCTYDRDAAALAHRIDQAVSDEEPGGRWLVSVVRPNASPGRKPRRHWSSYDPGDQLPKTSAWRFWWHLFIAYRTYRRPDSDRRRERPSTNSLMTNPLPARRHQDGASDHRTDKPAPFVRHPIGFEIIFQN